MKDKPSIDSSEAAPKTEEPSTESKPAEAEAGAEEAAKPTEDKSEAAVEKKETEEEEKKKEEVKEQGGDAPLVKLALMFMSLLELLCVFSPTKEILYDRVKSEN